VEDECVPVITLRSHIPEFFLGLKYRTNDSRKYKKYTSSFPSFCTRVTIFTDLWPICHKIKILIRLFLLRYHALSLFRVYKLFRVHSCIIEIGEKVKKRHYTFEFKPAGMIFIPWPFRQGTTSPVL